MDLQGGGGGDWAEEVRQYEGDGDSEWGTPPREQGGEGTLNLNPKP